jgi:hypothetical protein
VTFAPSRAFAPSLNEDWKKLTNSRIAPCERLLALAGAIAQLELAVDADDPDMVKALVGLRVIAAERNAA